MFCEILAQMDAGVCIVSLSKAIHDMETFLRKIDICSTIVFIGPCYINTYPADVFVLLNELPKHSKVLHGQNIYGVIQGGMPYVHTHEEGLHALALFAES